MLAHDIISATTAAGWDVVGFSSSELDICDAAAVESVLSEHGDAHTLINCAAYTKVDDCETNISLATAINGDGPGIVAEWCHRNGVVMVHFSTDYVFDGTKDGPYLRNRYPPPC